MRQRKTYAIIFLLSGLAAINEVAFAHDTEMHGKAAAVDTQMKKLHAMMPMFSLASAALETALKNGDVTAVETEANKIIAAIPALKKAKPHKNIKKRKKFVEFASSFEVAMISTLDLAKKGDFTGAKTAFNNAGKACADCHAKFRN